MAGIKFLNKILVSLGDSMTRYIAKPDTWFDEGTEAILIADYREKGFEDFPISLFEGWRTCENDLSEGLPIGTCYRDQEDCGFDEFIILEEGL